MRSHVAGCGIDFTVKESRADNHLIFRGPRCAPSQLMSEASSTINTKMSTKNAKQKTKWAVDLAIHDALDSVGRNESAKRALRTLITVVQERTDLLNRSLLAHSAAWNQLRACLLGLVNLSEHHADWVRSSADWAPVGRSGRLQFGSLARHLLATHDVPNFMTSVWLIDPSQQARLQQKWYKHVALGNSIRGTDVPVPLSKRMAAAFLLAPDHYSVDEALAWSSCLGQMTDAWEPFPFGPSRRRRKRSVVRRAQNWKEASECWKPILVADFQYVEEQQHAWSHLKWTIRQIVTKEELVDEGKTLSHCVATYADRCAAEETSIWSMKSHGSLSRRRVLTIQVDPTSRTVIYASGLRNCRPTERQRAVIRKWAQLRDLSVANYV